MYDATYPKFRAGSLALAAFLTLPLLLGCQSANRNQKLYGSAAYWQTAQGRAGLYNQPPVQSQSPIYQRGSMYPTAGYGGAGYGNMGYGGAGYGAMGYNQFNRNAMGPQNTAYMFNPPDPCAALRQSGNRFVVSGGTMEIAELRKKCAEQTRTAAASPTTDPATTAREPLVGEVYQSSKKPWLDECKQELGKDFKWKPETDKDGIPNKCEETLGLSSFPALDSNVFNGFRVALVHLKAPAGRKSTALTWLVDKMTSKAPLNEWIAQLMSSLARPGESDVSIVRALLQSGTRQRMSDANKVLDPKFVSDSAVTVIRAGYEQPIGYDANKLRAASGSQFYAAALSGVFDNLTSLNVGDAFMYVAEGFVNLAETAEIHLGTLSGGEARPQTGAFFVFVDGETKLNSIELTHAGSSAKALNGTPVQLHSELLSGSWHHVVVALISQQVSNVDRKKLIEENVLMKYPDGGWGRLLQEIARPNPPDEEREALKEFTVLPDVVPKENTPAAPTKSE